MLNGATEVEIPDEIEGFEVEIIDRFAFWPLSDLEEVSIPETVTAIYEYAFQDCTGLSAVNFSEGLQTLGDGAFISCTALTEIILPDSVEIIGENVFQGCSGLTDVDLGCGVQSIGSGAFLNCSGLMAITFPESLETIGSKAFINCTALESIEFSEGLNTIGEEAFRNTAVVSLDIPDSVTSIGESAFYVNSQLKSVIIGSGVTELEPYTFASSAVETVEILGNLTSIGDYAFYICDSLTEINLPNGLESIGNYAFQYCNSLSTITIPSSVVSVGESAFSTCVAMESAWILSSTATFGSGAFAWMSEDFIIYGYSGSTAETFASDNSLTFVVIDGTYRALTVTVTDSAGNVITDSYTITWYNSEGTELSTSALVLSEAEATADYSYKVTLSEELALVYSQPARQTIASTDSAESTLVLTEIQWMTVTGQVVDSNGNAISSATVTATQGIVSAELSTETEADGSFSFETPCTIVILKVSADGYYSKMITVSPGDILTDSYDVGTCILAETVSDQVIMDISLYDSKIYDTDEESDDTESEDTGRSPVSMGSLEVTLTRQDGSVITDYEIQNTSAVFMPDVVSAGETVIVTVRDRTGEYLDSEPVAVELNNEKVGTAEISMTQKGGFVLTGLEGPMATMTLYDAGGVSVLSETATPGKIYGSLEEGTYTLLLIEKTSLLRSVADPAYLSSIGLSEGTDYLKEEVTVENGLIRELSGYVVPELDEDKISYVNAENTSLTISKASGMTIGEIFNLRAEYEIDESKSVSAQSVQIIFPEGVSPTSDRIALVDGVSTVYSYDSGNRTATVNVSGKDNAVVYLYCQAEGTPGEYAIGAYLALSGSVLQPLGTVKATVETSSISVPERTSESTIITSGITAPNSTVTIYDNDEVVAQVSSNAAGSWSTSVPLAGKLYSYSYHFIYAAIESDSFDETAVTGEELVVYDERNVDVVTIKMYNVGDYGEQETILDFTDESTEQGSYLYTSEFPAFTFQVEMEGDELLDELYVLTVNNYGDETYVELSYDDETDTWIGSYDYTSIFDIPAEIGVAYSCDELTEIPDDEEFYNDLQEALEQLYKGSLSSESLMDYFLLEYNEDTGMGSLIYEEPDTSERVCVMTFQYIVDEVSSEIVTENLEADYYIPYDDSEAAWVRIGFSGNSMVIESIDMTDQIHAMLEFDFSGTEEAATVALSIAENYDDTSGNFDFSWIDFSDIGTSTFLDYTSYATGKAADELANDIIAGPLMEATSDALGSASGMMTAATTAVSIGEMVETREELMNNGEGNLRLLEKELNRLNSVINKKCNDGSLKLGSQDYAEAKEKYRNFSKSIEQYKKEIPEIATTSTGPYVIGVAIGTTMTGVGEAVGVLAAAGYIAASATVWPLIIGGVAVSVGVACWSNHVQNNLKKTLLQKYNELMTDMKLLERNVQLDYKDCEPKNKNTETLMKSSGKKPKGTADPSGYVYEAVPSNRLSDVTAVISYNNSGGTVVWDAENYNQINPQVTGLDGAYRWDVPFGEWRVDFTKDGYLPADTTDTTNASSSGWLEVPPIQLDVNVDMISTDAPEVTTATAYTDRVEVAFSQYMDIDSVKNATSLTRDGTAVSVNVVALDAEDNLEGTIQYATRFAVVPVDNDLSGSLVITVAGSAENYAGTPLGETYVSGTLTASVRPTEISGSGSVEAVLHESASIALTLEPGVAGHTLTVENLTPSILTVDTGSVVTDDNGNAVVVVEGDLLGTGLIVVTDEESGLTKTIEVSVVLESSGSTDDDENTIQPVTAYLSDGTVLSTGMTISAGSEITLVTETEGATIRYTLNDTCPCKEEALYYTGPFVIEEDTVLRAAAEIDGVYSATIRLELSVSEEDAGDSGNTDDSGDSDDAEDSGNTEDSGNADDSGNTGTDTDDTGDQTEEDEDSSDLTDDNENSDNSSGSSHTRRNSDSDDDSGSSSALTSSGGRWIHEDLGWWYSYDNGGYPRAEWKQLVWNNRTDWYYFDAAGWLVTGWFTWNGNLYYLHPYADGTQGYMYTGWRWIDGRWYYFDASGALLINGTTPDGYQTDETGARIE
ncbi:MAG: leucine-rich repeat protein [Clostridiales bacterium]|nr:leucine-rich repeat protein [Clostridiales bacterium]